MKKVKFIEIKAESSGLSLGRGRKFRFPNVNKKIETMIKDGWEFCGYVPVETAIASNLEKISLIFQKEVDNSENN
ncbi:MAG: DUF4177 domain-containing protein [Bacilli bacterium]|nr:DUF4177 domain-containing protein [Bacilli bacterium]